MTNKMTLTAIANDSKALNTLVSNTIKAYKAVGVQLHQTACALFWHVAEHGECHALNEFYNGLRVNDQTALRVWFGEHASFIDLANNESRNWIKFSTKEGFSVVKGTLDHRKDKFLVEDVAEGKTTLIALKPFFEKNVKDKDALTIEELVSMLAKAADRATKKAADENIQLPADILKLTTEIKNVTGKVSADLARIKE